MASSTTSKLRCAVCEKALGVFACRGCSKNFCLVHAAEHRQELKRQMDEEIVTMHNEMQQSFNELIANPENHPLVKEVDLWEKNSIKNIKKFADDTRKTLIVNIGSHVQSVKRSIVEIAQELTQARGEDDFFEADIAEWKQKLQAIQDELNISSKIRLQQDNSLVPLVSQILIQEQSYSQEHFDNPLGGILVEANGQLITHDSTQGHAAIRGTCEYSFGRHRLKFRIERLGSEKWILFGIISKSVPLNPEPFYNSPKSCGWSGHDCVFINGTYQKAKDGYKTDIEVNDIVELFIDCDQRKISRANKRTGKAYELDIDTNICPLPWQLSLNLFDAYASVRIIQ